VQLDLILGTGESYRDVILKLTDPAGGLQIIPLL
jgi:hypothetical protein